MFDITFDNTWNTHDSVKDITLDKLSGIYIRPTNKYSEHKFFENYNGFWTYETIEGKFDYKIEDQTTFTVGDLMNQLYPDGYDDINIRVFDFFTFEGDNKPKTSFIKTIMPANHRSLQHTAEIFGTLELRRILDIDRVQYKDDPEKLAEFDRQAATLLTDVTQVIRLISAQGLNGDGVRDVYTIVGQILAGIPLSEITDDEFSTEDWIDYSLVGDVSTLNEYLSLEGYTLSKLFMNSRCTRIVKAIYIDNSTNEEFTHYYDTVARLFIDTADNGEAYFGTPSVDEITLPWRFTPISEVVLDNDSDDFKKDLVKFSDLKLM